MGSIGPCLSAVICQWQINPTEAIHVLLSRKKKSILHELSLRWKRSDNVASTDFTQRHQDKAEPLGAT